MKSVLKVSLAALTLAFAVSSHAADKKLVVATDTAFVPFEFKQGDKYVGFDVDLWAAIAKELKLDYELKPMDFSGIIPALQTKNVDLERRGGVLSDYYPGAELYSASSGKKDENPVIEFKNVSKHFGPTQVLHNIDLNIAQGEVVVIIGPSGSGKSTLLRCINKLEEITSGDLIVDGLKVNDPKVDERLIRQEAGMVFQQFYLFPHLTALENVMFGPLRVRGANKEEAEKLARELLAKVGLAERAHHYPSELSGGQQQRVAIARALAVKPKMMLFDEPTSALDPELRHEVLKVMQDLAEEGMTMVIVTHEIGFAEKVASRLIFIDKGRIAEDGDPQVLIKNPPSQRLQEFLQHVS